MRKFARSAAWRLLLFIGFSMACSAWAESLVHLADGAKTTAEELLAADKVLVYIEKDCVPCARYLRTLGTCSEKVRSRVALVSVSTPAQSKEIARRTPRGMPVYVLSGDLGTGAVSATPTTRWRAGRKIGPLGCGEVGGG